MCLSVCVDMFARLGVATSMCMGFPGIDVRPSFMSKWISEPATNDGRGESDGEEEEKLRGGGEGRGFG